MWFLLQVILEHLGSWASAASRHSGPYICCSVGVFDYTLSESQNTLLEVSYPKISDISELLKVKIFETMIKVSEVNIT